MLHVIGNIDRVNVNKQKLRYWFEINPNCRKPLYSENVTVWYAMSSRAIIGSFFLRMTTATQRNQR